MPRKRIIYGSADYADFVKKINVKLVQRELRGIGAIIQEAARTNSAYNQSVAASCKICFCQPQQFSLNLLNLSLEEAHLRFQELQKN